MKYCPHCGTQTEDTAKFCPNCGHRFEQETDASSIGFFILCFFFPIAGLVLYLVWKDTYPLKAKSCGKGALVSVIVEAVLTVLFFLIYFLLFFFVLSFATIL